MNKNLKLFEVLKNLNLRNFKFLTAAGIINAFCVKIFIAPVNLYDAGISGSAILASQLTPDYLSTSLF